MMILRMGYTILPKIVKILEQFVNPFGFMLIRVKL